MRKLFAFAIGALLLVSCTSTTNDENSLNSEDHQIMAVLWFQKSAENRALFYQAYNTATLMLEKNISALPEGKKPAVVLDLDETVVDNSPNQGKMVLAGEAHNKENWKAWTDLAKADVLPGAREFLEYAANSGVEIFYVSNRDSAASFETTLTNLRNLGLPSADAEHLMLKTTLSSKEPRRQAIMEKYEIVLLIGDNLADMEEVFEERGEDYGFEATDSRRELFGTRYIVLPNPMYGNWTAPATAGSQAATTGAKMKESLVGY